MPIVDNFFMTNSSYFLFQGVPGFPKKEKQLAKKLKREMSNYEELNRIYGEAETEFIYDSFSLPHSANGPGILRPDKNLLKLIFIINWSFFKSFLC